jgi:acetylornithine deacetylase/succinyl-diaminopimelate desuccinylase-like protein
MSDPVPALLDAVDAGLEASIGRLSDWLRIPSISAQPAHAGDCAAAAEWAAAQLRDIGFTAAVRPTAGHPAVVAHHPGPGGTGLPRVLFYGHYDVQPAEPVELWTSPPFAPALVEGRHGRKLVARGAVDDKGQTMMWLEALRAWHAGAGGPPVPVTVLIEGEEEVGSPSLEAFLGENRDGLAADVAVISDTGMWDIDTPAVTTRLRGMVYAEILLKAASRDLHSGMYGGSALNPINALAKILGGLHDENGRVTLPGFYDSVRPVAPALAAQWEALGFDEGEYLGDIGLSVPAGERDQPALTRMWARPTADINGIWGGYAGAGSKTVIAAEAGAKVSFRLVPDQDPQAVVAGLRAFLAARTPSDAKVELRVFSTAPAIEVSSDSAWVAAAQAALAEEYGRPAVLIGSGGSIPVVDSLRRVLGIDSLLVGFGLDDDQVHSPNEKFEMRCYHHGIRTHVRLLGRLAGQ